jgi:hypothetical protein
MNDHLINSSLASTQIIAALKAEDGNSQTALNAAAAAAEQRWPLLKSLTPQKWAIAPALTPAEKNNRNILDPVDTVIRKPAASAPNINAQLASALNRMNPVKTKPTPFVAQVKTPPPIQTPAFEKPRAVAPAVAPITVAQSTLPPAPTPPLKAAQQESNAQGDSIQAVLHRIEQAHLPVQTGRTKVPGFLARLGKR